MRSAWNRHTGYLSALSIFLLVGCSDDTTVKPRDSRASDTTTAADGPANKPDGVKGDVGTKGDGSAPAGEWAALTKGTLLNSDLAAAKTTHDTIAKGGEAASKAAGNFAFDPLLSTKLLGGTENQYASISRWNNPDGLKIYDSPQFKAALATLLKDFTVEKFKRRKDWYEWGTLDSADTVTPRYFVIVRGTAKAADEAAAKAVQDAGAKAVESTVKAAGDVAHNVYLGIDDWKQVMIVDVWKDSANIEKTYGDPNFQKALGDFFATTPTLTVYKAGEWYGY